MQITNAVDPHVVVGILRHQCHPKTWFVYASPLAAL